MTFRLLAFACGLLAGLALHAALAPQDAGTPAAAAALVLHARADTRCPARPLKMPCLFDTVR